MNMFPCLFCHLFFSHRHPIPVAAGNLVSGSILGLDCFFLNKPYCLEYDDDGFISTINLFAWRIGCILDLVVVMILEVAPGICAPVVA